jgi:hypothetical protein
MAAAVAPKKVSGMRPVIRVAIQVMKEKISIPYVITLATIPAGITRMILKNTAARLSRPVVTVRSTG